MDLFSLLENLKLDLEWAEANEWVAPICLADDLQETINIIEKEMEELWLHMRALICTVDWIY